MKRSPTVLAFAAYALWPSLLAAQTADVRFGNLHSHTSYSDGSGTPADAFRMACQAGLDFFAITEHNHAAGDGKGDRRDGKMIATQPALYKGRSTSLVETADRMNRAQHCVTIYGQEFSTISSGNHVNVFDVGSVIDVPNGAFDKLVGWMESNKDSSAQVPVAQFNHPQSGRTADKEYGRDDFGNEERQWVQSMAPHVTLIEVLNAPALKDGRDQRTHAKEQQFFRYLNLGFHLAPSVGQDNHYRNWGVSTDARVAVITPDFTRAGILDALRKRHAYATEDKNLRLVFKANGALQGDIVAPPAVGSELKLTLEIRDDDEPDADYRVDVFKDVAGEKPAAAPVESYEITGNQVLDMEGIRFERAGEYVFVRVTQYARADDEHVEDDKAWTAPVWFEADGHHPLLATQPLVRLTRLIPDPSGDDVQKESITLKNGGSAPINLIGWKVRDLADNSWPLDGVTALGAGQSVTVQRNGMPMSMNNGGDEIELVAPDGSVVQTVKYGSVTVGEEVRPDGQNP